MQNTRIVRFWVLNLLLIVVQVAGLNRLGCAAHNRPRITLFVLEMRSFLQRRRLAAHGGLMAALLCAFAHTSTASRHLTFTQKIVSSGQDEPAGLASTISSKPSCLTTAASPPACLHGQAITAGANSDEPELKVADHTVPVRGNQSTSTQLNLAPQISRSQTRRQVISSLNQLIEAATSDLHGSFQPVARSSSSSSSRPLGWPLSGLYGCSQSSHPR